MNKFILFTALAVLFSACETETSEISPAPELTALSGNYKMISYFDGYANDFRNAGEFYFAIRATGSWKVFQKSEQQALDTYEEVLDGSIRHRNGSEFEVVQGGSTVKTFVTAIPEGLEIRFQYVTDDILYTDLVILHRVHFNPEDPELPQPVSTPPLNTLPSRARF